MRLRELRAALSTVVTALLQSRESKVDQSGSTAGLEYARDRYLNLIAAAVKRREPE